MSEYLTEQQREEISQLAQAVIASELDLSEDGISRDVTFHRQALRDACLRLFTRAINKPQVILALLAERDELELRTNNAPEGKVLVDEVDLRALVETSVMSGRCDQHPCPVGGQPCEDCKMWLHDDDCRAALLTHFGLPEVRDE